MKATIATLVAATALISGSAFAGGAQSPAAPATCVVQDSGGQNIAVQNAQVLQGADGAQLLSGSTEAIEYLVTLRADKSATLSFGDKRSGDKAVVDEGEFSEGEVVAVSLVTDEAPKAPFKLICTAQ